MPARKPSSSGPETPCANRSSAPSDASGATSGSPRRGSRARRWFHEHRSWWIAAAIVLFVETFVFNLGFWASLPHRFSQPTAETAAASARFELGPGLTDTAIPHMYTIADGTGTYVETTGIDKPVYCVRINTVAVPDWLKINDMSYEWWAKARVEVKLAGERTPSAAAPPANAVSDTQSGWIVGPEQSYSPFSPSSTTLTVPDAGQKISALRIRFEQPLESTIGFNGATLNAYPNFAPSGVRLLFMTLIALFIVAFAPGSRLWRTELDPTHRRRQRWLVLLAAAPLLLMLVVCTIQNPYIDLSCPPGGDAGNYVYDFNQYDWIATSLLHGHPWEALQVPAALAKSSNPYSMQTRAHLLSRGVMPIFWDHAFWHGHWYCYFGVLPVVLMFIPFQLVTSIWVPGGLGLSTVVACIICLLAFSVGSTLLVTRILQRFFPGASLACAILCVLGFQTGSQFLIMFYRQSFYELPYDSALALVTFGLLLWLGARRLTISEQRQRTSRRSGGKGSSARSARRVYRTRMWTVDDRGSSTGMTAGEHGFGPASLSKWRLFGGTLCIAATVGCRPPFAIAIILAFPIFWEEIRDGQFFSWLRPSFWREGRQWRSLGNDLSVLLTGLLTALPFLAYNYWRFHRLFDFGNTYQLTVNDMMTYKAPRSVLMPLVYYYLFQPLRLSWAFPLVHVNATPLPAYQFREPWMAGIVFTVPYLAFAVVAWCLLRVLRRRQLAGLTVISTVCGLALCVFDSALGGLSMRYTFDFGWLLTIPAVFGTAAALEMLRRHDQRLVEAGSLEPGRISRATWWTRVALLVLVGIGLLLAIQMYFSPNRLDDLIKNNPQLWCRINGDFSEWTHWL